MGVAKRIYAEHLQAQPDDDSEFGDNGSEVEESCPSCSMCDTKMAPARCRRCRSSLCTDCIAAVCAGCDAPVCENCELLAEVCKSCSKPMCGSVDACSSELAGCVSCHAMTCLGCAIAVYDLSRQTLRRCLDCSCTRAPLELLAPRKKLRRIETKLWTPERVPQASVIASGEEAADARAEQCQLAPQTPIAQVRQKDAADVHPLAASPPKVSRSTVLPAVVVAKSDKC